MKKYLYVLVLIFAALIGNAYAQEAVTSLIVPPGVVHVYVILQAPGEPVDGSSSTLDVVSRERFIIEFERYRNIARQKQVKLIVTAVTDDEKWIQNLIKYRGKNLRRALYRDPYASITYSGAEVPLD